MPPSRPLSLVVASGFVVGAAFHAAAIARGGPDPGSSPERHAAFVAINLLCAAGFVWRPRGFTVLFAALTAQQLASHGALAWRLWRDAPPRRPVARRARRDARAAGDAAARLRADRTGVALNPPTIVRPARSDRSPVDD